MNLSKENIKSVFIWIGIILVIYVFNADAKPKQALQQIENGNAPQVVKNQFTDCEQILNDIDRVGLKDYVFNGQRDAPAAPQYYEQRNRAAPEAPQPKERKKWNPFQARN